MVLFPFVVMKEVIRMGRNYKTVRNGKGTELIIGEGKYISAGAEGKNVTIRGNGKMLAFDGWDDLVNAINEDKAVYCKHDYPYGMQTVATDIKCGEAWKCL
jgi:hypothetical protein